MRDFATQADDIEEMLRLIEEDVKGELAEQYPEAVIPQDRPLFIALGKVHAAARSTFIFLIDEWDDVFRMKGVSQESQMKYLDFLRALLKDKPYVALAYMTGILPVKKYGEHSALNMFTEYSMIESIPLSGFMGFTLDEVKELCRQHDIVYDEMQSWYNGYLLDGRELYNPRSVVQVCLKKSFGSYWTKTETYEALKVYIEMNMDGLRDTIISMMAGEKTEIDTHSFNNDMTSFKTRDDVLTLLIHLGYLTFDSAAGKAWIPNQEVMAEFATTIKVLNWSGVADALRESDKLLKATLCKESDIVEVLLEKAHQSETSIMAYNDENALAAVITVAYYTARKQYDLVRELPGGKGFADVCFISRRNVEQPAMMVELKVNHDAETAIDQIRKKEYTEGLAGYRGKVLLVGIAYDKKTKKHHCIIEETVK